MSVNTCFSKIILSHPNIILETEWVLKNSKNVPREEIRELLESNFKLRKARNSNGDLRVRNVVSISKTLSQFKEQRAKLISFAQEAHRENYKDVEKVIPEIAALLTDFTSANPVIEDQIKQSLGSFVQATLNFLPGHFSIESNEACNGISGDIVYRIVDTQTKEIIAIVKTFKANSQNFLPEIWGLNLSRELENGIKIHSAGKMYCENSPIFLVAMKVASGKQIQEILEQPFKLTQDPEIASKPDQLAEKRKVALNNAFEALYAAGQGLAKLHLQRISAPLPLHNRFIEELRTALYLFIPKLQLSPIEGIEIEILQRYVEYIISVVQKDNHSRGIIHYDPHVGNMFYHKSTKAHSFIDLSGISKSLDGENQPIGFLGWDYHKVIENIKAFILSDEEQNQVIHAFKEGYGAAGGTIPTQAQSDFLFLYDELEAIRNEMDSPNKEQWWWIRFRLPVLERSIANIRQKLHDFKG